MTSVNYYNPTIGRFTSEDPIGMKADNNFFRFVNNNPVNGNDPFGLFLSDDLNRFPDPNGNKATGGNPYVSIYDYLWWTTEGMAKSIVNTVIGSGKGCPCEKMFWDCMRDAYLPGWSTVAEGTAYATGGYLQGKAWQHAAMKNLTVPLRSSIFRPLYNWGQKLGPGFGAGYLFYEVSKCLIKEIECLRKQ